MCFACIKSFSVCDLIPTSVQEFHRRRKKVMLRRRCTDPSPPRVIDPNLRLITRLGLYKKGESGGGPSCKWIL
jgi:hypothetical protein